jgi:hypothetical protein
MDYVKTRTKKKVIIQKKSKAINPRTKKPPSQSRVGPPHQKNHKEDSPFLPVIQNTTEDPSGVNKRGEERTRARKSNQGGI